MKTGISGGIAQRFLNSKLTPLLTAFSLVLGVGAVLSATTDAGECQVFYRQATPREDGKVGFDVVCE